MRPEEPHALCELLQLRMDVAHERDERACAAVRRNERPAVRAPERVPRVVADGPREEAAMHVQ